jgi:plasmid stabilization system protein ParE
MSVPVVYRRRVQSDLAAAFDWYEEQSPGLGENLLSSVGSIFKSIEDFPEIFAFVHGSVRRAIIRRFPFAIFSLVEPSRIVILRVLHTSRDPRIWPRPREK